MRRRIASHHICGPSEAGRRDRARTSHISLSLSLIVSIDWRSEASGPPAEIHPYSTPCHDWTCCLDEGANRCGEDPDRVGVTRTPVTPTCQTSRRLLPHHGNVLYATQTVVVLVSTTVTNSFVYLNTRQQNQKSCLLLSPTRSSTSTSGNKTKKF